MRTYKLPNLWKLLRSTNMQSKNYNPVPNQFIIEFEKGRVFQSYNSIIVVQSEKGTYIGRDYDYSKTTWIYRNMFLNEDLQTTRKKIKNWEYKMLNK